MSSKTDQRAKEILRLLLSNGKTSIEELVKRFGASPASIRRDLVRLEERGLLHRTQGGAMLSGQPMYEPFRFDAAFLVREDRFPREKQRIAAAAASLVNDGDTIALSPGTTTSQIARALRHRKGIHIVTSAVNIGMELSSQASLRVTLTGGSFHWPGSFSMVGVTAFDALQKLYFEKVFMGACGIHPQHGLTVIQPEEALILSEMVKHAKQVIAVADSSKLGMVSAVRVCTPAQINTIITDDGANAEVIQQFRDQQILVISV